MPGVWKFAFRRFSNTKQAAPKMAWTLRCSLGGTQTLNKSINNSQIPFERLLRHPSHSSRQHGTLKDAVRHQKAPTDTRKAIQCEQEPPRILEQPFGVPVCWFLLVSVLVLNCPEIPGGGDCEHMGEVYVCLWGMDVCKDVLECSGLAWWYKCSILEMHQKAKLHAPDTFKTSKYKNLPI